MKPIRPDIFVKRILSDIRVGELEPKEATELRDFARSAGFEKTITSKTKLSVIYELWLDEKAKQRKNRQALKKTEKILNAQTLTFWEIAVRKRGYEKERAEKGKKKSKWELGPSQEKANPFAGLKKNLHKLGIDDDEKIEELLDSLKKTKNLKCEYDTIAELDKRVERILEAYKGRMEEARETFSEQPSLLALPDKRFDELLEKAEKPYKT
jgi:hypothetical protein